MWSSPAPSPTANYSVVSTVKDTSKLTMVILDPPNAPAAPITGWSPTDSATPFTTVPDIYPDRSRNGSIYNQQFLSFPYGQLYTMRVALPTATSAKQSVGFRAVLWPSSANSSAGTGGSPPCEPVVGALPATDSATGVTVACAARPPPSDPLSNYNFSDIVVCGFTSLLFPLIVFSR